MNKDYTPIKFLKQALREYLEEGEELVTKEHRRYGLTYQPLLYALVRQTKPNLVIETGVRTGVTSYFILEALEANQCGTLLSCDPMFPNMKDAIERTCIPEKLTNRWTFHSGLSKMVLSKKLSECDIFVHDSDHGYENVKFELGYAVERTTTAIVVDDPWWGVPRYPTAECTTHIAFEEFLEEHGEKFERYALPDRYCEEGTSFLIRLPDSNGR